MSYLLDTNVVSETVRRRQDKMVIGWLEQILAEALFVSVLTLVKSEKVLKSLQIREEGRSCARGWSTSFRLGLRRECFRSI
jgi:predicted nucleic acid-binding protein